MVTAFLLALVTGSLVYCALVMIAARAYLRQRPANLSAAPPISVLSPLEGIEDGLERNLRSFFEQRYPAFELLFAVRRADDPALDVVRRLMAEFPGVPARILITGEPPYPNAKVFSLQRMHAVAAHEVLVMKDSDVRAGPDMIQTIAAEFQDAAVGLVTCPYQAIAARGFWWKLDALGMNTQFLGGVLVARMLEGMRFALGPAIAIRKRVLADIGGLDSLTDYLAEDFVMGQAASGRGHGVILSSYVIEHHIGGGDFSSNMRHRLRWVRSTRRSRPKGYVGELFTNPVPLASALLVWNPSFWPVALGTLLVRYVTAWVTLRRVLRRRVTFQDWFAIPFQDLLSFLFWLAGFFGKTVLWRGRQYQLGRDGRIALH
ncbi:MAG TPA: bacteriohopanetetrol glucosamine biosynthesis glycosyltransferase HpnI [Bryobacteraceae bacterium]|nr:bacteriohopanetetrol glucosamine biosynthesis glycosyltransferase HpnI [Bryobacteraceae bacterium]